MAFHYVQVDLAVGVACYNNSSNNYTCCGCAALNQRCLKRTVLSEECSLVVRH